MNKTTKTILIILGLGVALFLLWYFRYLVGCFLIAAIVAAIGRPLVNLLKKVPIGKKKIGNSLAAGITLLSIVGIVFLLFWIFAPMIASQAASFSNIDTQQLLSYYQEPINNIKNMLLNYGFIENNMSIQKLLSTEIARLFKMVDYNMLISNVLYLAKNIILGFFIVLFVSFFLLKDSHLLINMIDALTPEKHIEEVRRILKSSQNLISRYFIGICSEICLVTLLLWAGYSIFGFSNALLIAAFCGILVIIPYIGSVIGGLIGLGITLASTLSINPSAELLPLLLKFVGVFVAVKLIDDFVLQPSIYSKSVKAHPLEIFFVILIAGELGGIVGMILAIPVYTLVRIIAKEFFSNSKLVKTLTKNL